jgi:hypothetical protein
MLGEGAMIPLVWFANMSDCVYRGSEPSLQYRGTGSRAGPSMVMRISVKS